MVVYTLLTDIQKVLDRIRAARGPFVLAMLYNRAEASESGWNLIVAAHWTDELGIADSTKEVVRALSEGLGLENKVAISRVTVLRTDDSFVRDVNSYFNIQSPEQRQAVKNMSAGGVLIGSGYIFYSQGLVAKWNE